MDLVKVLLAFHFVFLHFLLVVYIRQQNRVKMPFEILD